MSIDFSSIYSAVSVPGISKYILFQNNEFLKCSSDLTILKGTGLVGYSKQGPFDHQFLRLEVDSLKSENLQFLMALQNYCGRRFVVQINYSVIYYHSQTCGHCLFSNSTCIS